NPQTIEKSATEIKSLSASGFVNTGGPSAPSGDALPAPVITKTEAKAPVLAPTGNGAASAETYAEFAKMDNQLGFPDLHDHDVLPFAQTAIRVKGMLGNSFRVLVNGKELSAKQVGTKTTVANKQMEIWEFIGVNLQPGSNIIEVSQV